MKDDAYRRILQLERRVQSLSEELISVRNQRRNVPMPGSRMALLQPVSSIAGMTESSGTYSVSHGAARIYDLIVRDTTSAWEMTKVSGDSVDKTVMLGNVSTEALPADQFVFALSYNGIYLNTLGGGGVSLWRFTLNEDWASGGADADILEMDGTDTTTDADVLDPLGIFATLGTGDAGLCILQGGIYYAIQAPCPAT